jgi:hypothetical protein
MQKGWKEILDKEFLKNYLTVSSFAKLYSAVPLITPAGAIDSF